MPNPPITYNPTFQHQDWVDNVDRVQAGNDARDDGAGQLVDELAERRVLLRRPADHRERPDRPGPVVDRVHRHHREVVRQAVVAEVVAERPLGLGRGRVDGAGDDEVRFGGHGERGA